MLSVRTGSYRSLEEELVGRLRLRPPLEAAWVVVPSRHVRGRLQRAMAASGGLANVFLPDFHALARMIVEEAGIDIPPLVEDVGEEEIFRAFLREPGASERYRVLADRPGAGALLRTVADLRAAVIAPPLLREVKEELPEDAQRLAELAGLLEAYGNFLKKLGYMTRSDVARVAAVEAEKSRLVKEAAVWNVYGFYEFLGEQKDLLDALSRETDATVWVPYREGPAYALSERTLNEDFGAARARQGGFIAAPDGGVAMEALKTKAPKPKILKGDGLPRTGIFRATAFTQRLFDPAESLGKIGPAIPAVTCGGTADEVWYAVKEARRVHESEGVAWRDIAIVARTLDRRLHLAARFFRDEAVPWWTPAAQPLAERPLAQAASLAARLLLDEAYHMDVHEWFSSPLVKDEVRADRWGEIARALGIVSADDWKRLSAARGAHLADEDGEEVASAEAVDAFAAAVDALRQSLPGAEGRRGWATLAASWERFLGDRLDAKKDEAAWKSLQDILHSLAALEGAGAPPDGRAFAAAFARGIAAEKIPVHPIPADGVAFLDAMQLRGQRFRVAVLLGLNERDWPAVPREDPYLPDASRRRIAAATGCRLRERMERASEERMLFAFALDCCDRAILVSRRVDDEGRKEAPSAFLDEIRRVVHVEDKAGVPRLPLRKFERKLGWLTWTEQRLRAILTGGVDADPVVVKAKALEEFGGWNAFDLLSAPPQAHLESVAGRGLSPTALQNLATCPFLYWARQVTKLDVLDPREAEEDVTAREVGSVLHEALADRSGADPVERARDIFQRRAQKRPPLRYAVWEAARDAGLKALAALVAQDRAELKSGGWTVAHAELNLPLLAGPNPLPGLHGRVDRVETRETKGPLEFRVTDFKYKLSKRPPVEGKDEKVEEKTLAEVLRGERVQLAAYARLVAAHLGPKAAFAGAQFYYFGPRFDPVRRGLLTRDGSEELASLAPRAWEMAANGRFVVVDDLNVCKQCEMHTVCRRGHFATRTRALNDPRGKAFAGGRFA
ncbi:MAG: ATP-dependent nuclease subunit B-like [Planctomycetota bacterium]|nr:MAG: ATP-dependent nuclease subunit B-like [Planctomycetota bacterium]